MSIVNALLSIKRLPAKTRAPVVLVDAAAEEILDAVPPTCSSLVVPVRGECWYWNWRIIRSVMTDFALYRRGRVGLRGLYVLAVCQSVAARVVITFIDNNNWDKGLVALKRFRYVCIQNGYRRLPELCDKRLDIYCTMNRLPSERFGEFNISINRVVYTGSFRLSTFHKRFRTDADTASEVVKRPRPRVLFPSQYRLPEQYPDKKRLSAQAAGEEKVCGWLGKMEEENLVELVIALTSPPVKAEMARSEIQYFENLLQRVPHFSRRSEDRWATYRELYSVDAVVGAGSTILHEAVELGLPTMYCFPLYPESVAEFYALGVSKGSVTIIQRDTTYDQFKAQVLGLQRPATQLAPVPSASDTIREIVSEML